MKQYNNFSDWLRDNCELFATETGYLDCEDEDLDEAFLFLSGPTFITTSRDAATFLVEEFLDQGDAAEAARYLLRALRGDVNAIGYAARAYTAYFIERYYAEDLAQWRAEKVKEEALSSEAERRMTHGNA